MKTKIICTIGYIKPEELEKTIKAYADSGMKIMRNNFSHCSKEEHRARLGVVKRLNKKYGYNIETLQDLRGPRIRIGELPESGIEVQSGDLVTFVTSPCKNKTQTDIPIDDPYLHTDVSVGDQILIEGGALELVVKETFADKHKILAEVIVGGTIYSKKGVNLPTTSLTTSSLTEKDIDDLKYGLKVGGLDYVAMSFVQDANDIKRLRKIIGRKPVKIVSKIERRKALENIDEIIDVSDAIMVARGDLGVEIPFENVPIVQKSIIRKCNKLNKIGIVATQMLSTMVNNPFPTRAEVSDVANAVFDGAHAIMLSDETANGKYPKEAIATMKKIAEKVEQYINL